MQINQGVQPKIFYNRHYKLLAKQIRTTITFLSTEKDRSLDILTVARNSGGNSFVDLLWATGLAEELTTSSGPVTLIVPSDAVFKNLASSTKRKLRDTCVLRKILRHHIVKERISLDNTPTNSILLSDQNKPIIFHKDGVRIDVMILWVSVLSMFTLISEYMFNYLSMVFFLQKKKTFINKISRFLDGFLFLIHTISYQQKT